VAEARSEERLAEIRRTAQQRDYQHLVVLGDCDRDCPACAVDDLLAEVNRLDTQAAYMREQIEQLAQVNGERKVQTVVYRALAEEHQKRGDKLSAQLVEVGETRLEFGYRFPGTDGDPDVQGYDDEATARRIANHGDTVMCRRVGDWEALPDA